MIYSATGHSSGRAEAALLTRNAFIVCVISLAAIAGCAQKVAPQTRVLHTVAEAILNNKVLFLSLAIAAWHLLRATSPGLKPWDLVAAVPALLLAAVAGGVWPWIGLSVSMAALLGCHRGDWGAGLSGVLIAMAAGIHETSVVLLGELCGDALLRIDAGVAGWLAGWFSPAVVHGTSIQQAEGHQLLLVWGCSSLSNLGDALLLFWSLVTLLASTRSISVRGSRLIFCTLALTVVIVAINAIRLALMASDPHMYALVHDGNAGAWLRMATIALTASISILAVQI